MDIIIIGPNDVDEFSQGQINRHSALISTEYNIKKSNLSIELNKYNYLQ